MSIYMGVLRRTEPSGGGIFFNYVPLAELTPDGFRYLAKQEVQEIFPRASQKDLQFTCNPERIPRLYEDYVNCVLLIDFGESHASDSLFQQNRNRYAIDENRVMLYIGQGKIKALPLNNGLTPEALETLARQREELEAEIQSLQEQKAALEAEKQKLQALQSQLDRLNAQKTEAETAFQTAAAEAAESQQYVESLQAMRDRLNSDIQALTARRDELEKTCRNCESESGKLRSTLQSLTDRTAHLEKQKSGLAEEKARLEADVANLTEQQQTLETYFQDVISKPWAKLETLQLDGKLAEWMQQALAQKKEEQPVSHFVVRGGNSRNLPAAICARVQKFRPDYSTLDILNIAVCLAQGFLTVFYGNPGCGKTSICNIFAHVLGMKVQTQETSARYVPVSVERGWMSKRDFIGYFNPLTKTFDSSNRQVYDALRILDSEPEYKKQRQKDGTEVLLDSMPFFILLDEANLSSMEYYWADFMNLCEDSLTVGRLSQSDGKTTVRRQIRGTVNLGEEQLEVPDWLRFLATINTDHTTETLSPRLIDRAWLISLPSSENDEVIDIHQLEQEVHPYHTSWRDMQEAFGGNGKSHWDSSSAQKAFQEIAGYLQKECGVAVSHRVRQAVRRYWTGACGAFKAAWPEKAPYPNPETAALDYAIAQRVLPQLNGSGADFYGKLDGLYEKCKTYKLTKSAGIVQQVQMRGKDSEYFQFF